jgi:hypothetical protein
MEWLAKLALRILEMEMIGDEDRLWQRANYG